jgi:putative ABC transport system permease protein
MNDLKIAFRQLIKSPGFSTVVILTLGLGIGACTSIFSVVNRVLLQPLRYYHPEQLVELYDSYLPLYPRFSVAPGNFDEWLRESQSFSQLAAVSYTSMNLTGVGDPIRIKDVRRITTNYLSTVGVRPVLGRDFLPGDATSGDTDVMIISDSFWADHFGRRPDVVGTTVRLDNRMFTVVGVAPKSLSRPDVLVPMHLSQADWADHGPHYLDVVGRLKQGVTLSQARAELALISSRIATELPSTNKGWGVKIVTLTEETTGFLRTPLYTLLAAVGFLLVMACVNVANLLMVRGTARSREMAIRSAIGGNRFLIVRQLLVEHMFLAFAGGLLGMILSEWAIRVLIKLAPADMPRLDEITIDGWALAFSLGVALVSGLVFALVPAFQASRVDLNSVLKEGGRGSSEGTGRHRLRSALIVAELALAVILMVGSSLVMRSFVRIMKVDPGFRADGAVMVDIALPDNKYDTDAKQSAFGTRVAEGLVAIPGVTSAGITRSMPFHNDFQQTFKIKGTDFAPGEQPTLFYYSVSPGYFNAMGITLVRGRFFSDNDTATSQPIAIISETTARQFFPGVDPLGKLIHITNGPGQWSEIVGVVKDVKQFGLDDRSQPAGYEAFAQRPFSDMTCVIRTAGSQTELASSVRKVVSSVDPLVPIDSLLPVTDVVRRSVASQMFAMKILVFFSVAALLLAVLGIYGVMSNAVAQRTGEIAVRMALGAAPRSVIWLVLRQGALLSALGIAIGIATSIGMSRFIASMLFEIQPTDPISLAAASMILGGAALAVCLWSATRAAQIQPVRALREL